MSKLAEYTLFKDFPVSKLKFSLSGSLLAASSSFETSISIFQVCDTARDPMKKLVILKVGKSVESRQLKSIVDFAFCPHSERFLLVLVQNEAGGSVSSESDCEEKQLALELFDLASVLEARKPTATKVSSLE